jgi:hypothetical protein
LPSWRWGLLPTPSNCIEMPGQRETNERLLSALGEF